MSEFWVVGGEFVDSRFEVLAPGRVPERLGPFASYAEARKAWQARTMATIDNALTRYRIVEATSRAA